MIVEPETMNAARQASKMAIFEDESLQGGAETRQERITALYVPTFFTGVPQTEFHPAAAANFYSQRFQRDLSIEEAVYHTPETREARAAAPSRVIVPPAPVVNEYDNYDYNYLEEPVQRHQPQPPFAAAHSLRFRRDANKVSIVIFKPWSKSESKSPDKEKRRIWPWSDSLPIVSLVSFSIKAKLRLGPCLCCRCCGPILLWVWLLW